MSEQQPQPAPSRARKYASRAAIFGFVLALICHALPPEYRAACELVARVCTGGAAP